MFWRGVALWVAATLLSGCVTERSGFDYAAMMQKVGPPRAGLARIVVLQEKITEVGATVCDIKLDGETVGRLRPGTYLYADRPAGRHQLQATETLFPGESKRDITTESGRTYFFLARTSDRHKAVTGLTILGGLAGAVVASAATAASENPGPVDLLPLNETAARTTIAELQLAE